MTREGYEPTIAIPPGETIKEYLDSHRMSLKDLAKKLNLAQEALEAIIDGRVPVTGDVASGLELVFGSPARFWIALEASYRETKERLEKKASTKGK